MSITEILAQLDKWLGLFDLNRLSLLFALIAGAALVAAAYYIARSAWKTRFAGHTMLAGAEFVVVGAIALALMAALVYPISNALDNQLAELGAYASTGGLITTTFKWLIVAMLGMMVIIVAFVALVISSRPRTPLLAQMAATSRNDDSLRRAAEQAMGHNPRTTHLHIE